MLTVVVCSKRRDELGHVRVRKLGKKGVERVQQPRASNFADVGVWLQSLELAWNVAFEPTEDGDDAKLAHSRGLLNTQLGLLIEPPQRKCALVRRVQMVPPAYPSQTLSA